MVTNMPLLITKGDVLYHYIKDRNLNENLAKELSDSSEPGYDLFAGKGKYKF